MQQQLIIEHIVQWLTQYCERAKLQGFVVGVSGGIDSAVTSTLCALTGKPVHVLAMPILQKPEQHSLSLSHNQWLTERYDNVTAHTLDLTSSFLALQQSLPSNIQDPLSMANTRSRLRMLSLYAFASHHKAIVAGTGNKVEDFGVGFFTKYGDGGVDVSPIADLMKTEVYALAKHLGVAEAIQQAAPTDGLWEEDRTDESQLGASYPELEWAMRFLAQATDTEAESAEAGLSPRQQEVLAIYRRFHQANRHKMEPIPVCLIPPALLTSQAPEAR